MFFKDIPGKMHEKELLIKAVSEGKIPHAQMMLARAGSGHLPMALALGSFILCKDRQPTDSCGVCSSCIKSHKYSHPDMHFVFPVIKSGSLKRDDTSSTTWLPEWRAVLTENPFLDITAWQAAMGSENSLPDINKKECVNIVQKLGMKSYESDYKVLILWMPEYLKKEGNRLLKLIEEPTPDTIIIMVADRQEEILNTIISRVQITKIPAFTADEVGQYLAEKSGIDYDIARQYGVMAEGNLGLALKMVDGQQTDYSDALFAWMRIAYKMEPKAISAWIDDVSKWGREGQKNFVAYALHFFREYIFMLLTKSEEGLHLNEKEIQTAKKMMQTLDIEKVEKIVEVLDSSYVAIIRNANAKILFMADSVKIAYIMRGLDKEDGIFVA